MDCRIEHVAGNTDNAPVMRQLKLVIRERIIADGPLWALSLLLLLAFVLGGSARGDVLSLMFLRPMAILLLGYGLYGLTRAQVRAHRFLFAVAMAIIGLILIQLVPLPPAIWSQLPGRTFIVEIDRAAGLGQVWRPISLVPTGTWNAFYAMLVPVAVLVLGVQLSRDQRWQLLPIIIAIGVLSGLLGVLQLGSGTDGGLYFYDITNRGAADGLFANRNHQAVFLATLFPMLAVFASTHVRSLTQAQARGAAAVAIAAFLLPLILVTGSRAGLLAAGIGLLSVPVLYRPPEWPMPRSVDRRRWPVVALTALAVIMGLALLTVGLGRAEAINRMLSHAASEEFRFKAWGPTLVMVWDYFPIGAGFGSFTEVFQVHEPRTLLNMFYFNRAHNDWLEVALTGGVPACLLLVAVVMGFLLKMLRLPSAFGGREQMMAYLGVLLVVIFAVASVTDYPLRVPSLACLFVIAAVWISSCQTAVGHRETVQ